MKKVILTLSFAFIGIFSNAQQGSDLAKDPKVISYLTNEMNFNKNIDSQSKYNSLVDISRNDIVEEELPELYKIYNTNERDFNNHLNTQSSLSKYIEDKYHLSKFDANGKRDLLLPAVEQVYARAAPPNRCRNIYLAEVALHASVAVGAHFGCLAADLTVVGGIVCHSAVAVGQAASDYISYQNMLTCQGK